MEAGSFPHKIDASGLLGLWPQSKGCGMLTWKRPIALKIIERTEYMRYVLGGLLDADVNNFDSVAEIYMG